MLYDQLLRLYRNTDGQTLDSKLLYYSRFDLLCIDEFPNVSQMDPFLVQQMFNTFSERGNSILLCMQCQPEKMEELFSITSIGQSIKGRILQRAKRLSSQRCRSPSDRRLVRVSTVIADRFSEPERTTYPFSSGHILLLRRKKT